MNLAKRWACGLPGSLVIMPQAPDKARAEALGWGSDQDAGYDWLRHGIADTKDRQVCVQTLHQVTKKRVKQLNSWLDSLLKKYGLSDSQLILGGFSQGSIVAAVCGARRKVLGMIACGGLPVHFTYSLTKKKFMGDSWKDWEKLLPEHCSRGRQQTKCCIVNGTADKLVRRKKLQKMFATFDTLWHWDEGAGHHLYCRWQDLILKWMRRLVDGPD